MTDWLDKSCWCKLIKQLLFFIIIISYTNVINNPEVFAFIKWCFHIKIIFLIFIQLLKINLGEKYISHSQKPFVLFFTCVSSYVCDFAIKTSYSKIHSSVVGISYFLGILCVCNWDVWIRNVIISKSSLFRRKIFLLEIILFFIFIVIKYYDNKKYFIYLILDVKSMIKKNYFKMEVIFCLKIMILYIF